MLNKHAKRNVVQGLTGKQTVRYSIILICTHFIICTK